MASSVSQVLPSLSLSQACGVGTMFSLFPQVNHNSGQNAANNKGIQTKDLNLVYISKLIYVTKLLSPILTQQI